MSKSKMFGSGEPEDDDGTTASPRTTIVGGRPPEEDAATLPVPTGIQSLLRLASVDQAFRQQLIARRLETAEAANVDLTASEKAILTAIPATQLEQMSAMMPDPPTGRREFLQRTAAGAVVLLGGAALTACDSCLVTHGISPDVPPPRPEHRDTATEGGAAPDEPPRPDRVPSPPGGARPDLPPDDPPDDPPVRPTRPAPTRGIRPDRPKKKR